MFNYDKAFSRNIGWVTEDEQAVLSQKRLAIAGCGGVGFEHAVTLARMGIQNFNLSDFDNFEIHNMNRQAGCFVSTQGERKLDVLERTLLDINPNCNIKKFPDGISENNYSAFLENVDAYIDGLDFFVLDIRQTIFEHCQVQGIPALTAAPLGMGVSFLCFTQDSMSFDDYFGFSKAKDDDDKAIRFLLGLSPLMLQKKYLVDKTRTSFREKRGPSTPFSVKMCSGVLGTNTIKLLLGRGDVIKAPQALHFDAYRNVLKVTFLRFGNNGLIQRIKKVIAKRLLLN